MELTYGAHTLEAIEEAAAVAWKIKVATNIGGGQIGNGFYIDTGLGDFGLFLRRLSEGGVFTVDAETQVEKGLTTLYIHM